jgi:DNA-directed RNA polymerase specialized sigma24 family protein
LRKALERNIDWIKAHIPALASDSQGGARDIQAYIDWIYERLRDRIPPDPNPEEIDRLVRREVWKVFHGRRSRQPRASRFADVERIAEPEDQSARNFERALETADEVRACLECLPEEVRQLVIEAYTLTEGDLSSPGIRERLAKNLGISRNAVDQRLSRAIRSIRERMRKDPGSETT